MNPKWVDQNTFANVVKGICALSTAILSAMAVAEVLQSQLLNILIIKDILVVFFSNIHVSVILTQKFLFFVFIFI